MLRLGAKIHGRADVASGEWRKSATEIDELARTGDRNGTPPEIIGTMVHLDDAMQSSAPRSGGVRHVEKANCPKTLCRTIRAWSCKYKIFNGEAAPD